jgi:hypothetical protein
MASNKKPFALRIGPELLEALEKWAEDEFRSVNGQMEYLLSQAVHMRKRGIKVKPDNASDKTDHEH